MELDVNLGEQTPLDNLPDETEDEMLTTFHNVVGPDVDDGATNGLGRVDDDVVVLNHLELIHLLARIEDTFVNCVWDCVINELAEDETVLKNKNKKKRRGLHDRLINIRINDTPRDICVDLNNPHTSCNSEFLSLSLSLMRQYTIIHKYTPLHSSNSCIVWVGIGSLSPTSLSPAN